MIELTEQQESVIQQAVNWFYNESSQVFEIAGLAGTGKSVILMEIVRRLQLQPYQYLAAAYTGAAAVVMRMKGFPTARSLHATFYHYEKRVKKDAEDKDGNKISKLTIRFADNTQISSDYYYNKCLTIIDIIFKLGEENVDIHNFDSIEEK